MGELGRGGQGVVHQCTHRVSGLSFACKTIIKSSLTTAADEEDVCFEIAAMQQLKGHPFIVSLEEVFEDDHAIHLVMELCEGGELLDSILAKKTLPAHQAAQILWAVAQALKFYHNHGVMHRDVKAENVFLTASGEAKLGDFGLATRLTPGHRLHDITGTSDYLAPEVLAKDYDERAELWTLGVLLYIMLTGERLFSASLHGGDRMAAILNTDILHQFRRKCEDLSPSVTDLISRLLCLDPERRITLDQLLAHPWLASARSSSLQIRRFPKAAPTTFSQLTRPCC